MARRPALRRDDPVESQAPHKLTKTVPESSAHRSWTVVAYEHLPDFLKDNEFLLRGHRPHLPSMRACFKSIFRHHTETWNIWTHLLGAAVFVVLIFYLLTSSNEEASFDKKLVFTIFYSGAIFCMGCSALYHTLSCHSHNVCKIFAKLDYVGIIILIVASYPPWVHYGFRCKTIWKVVYLTAALICGLGCSVVCLMDRFSAPDWRTVRSALFIGLGGVGLVPALHYILDEGWWDALVHAWWLILMGLLYLTGAIIYGMRVPERYWPGKFDIVGQSHQIMHVCVIGGTLSCYYGAQLLAQHRIDNQLMCL